MTAKLRGLRRCLLFQSLLGIAAGIVAALWPAITILVFVTVIAVWALIIGGLMIGSAMSLKKSHGRGWLITGDIASIVYGALLLIAPLIGALVLTWWIAAHALVLGVTLLVLAYRLHAHRADASHGSMAPTAS